MRPGASYRGARRNEARRSRNGGPRVPMIYFNDILKINGMRKRRIQQEQAK